MVDQYSLLSNKQQPSSNRCDHHSIDTYFIDRLAQSTAASTDRSYNSSIEPQTNPKLQSAMSPVETTIEPMHDHQHMQSMLASSDQQSNRSYRWGTTPTQLASMQSTLDQRVQTCTVRCNRVSRVQLNMQVLLLIDRKSWLVQAWSTEFDDQSVLVDVGPVPTMIESMRSSLSQQAHHRSIYSIDSSEFNSTSIITMQLHQSSSKLGFNQSTQLSSTDRSAQW